MEGGVDKFEDYCKTYLDTKYLTSQSCPDDDGRIEIPEWETSFHILEILLDTEGAKAAYGGNVIKSPVDGDTYPKWHVFTQGILNAWHSEEGNNWQKAIDVAHSLL